MSNESPPPSRPRGGFGRSLLLAIGIVCGFLVLLIAVPLVFFRGPGVPPSVILELDLSGGLVESVPDDPIGAILGIDQLSLRDVVDALERAEDDDRVKGLIARVGAGSLSMPQVEELREAVAGFRASGKPAVAFAITFGEFGNGRNDYYLASAFDEIHLQPSGDVGLTGLIAETPFIGRALDELGVEPRMGYRYEYKDAVNLYTEEEMTAPQREATGRALTSMYETLIAGIAEGRGLAPAEVQRLIDTGPHMAGEALEARLVDRLSYQDEVYDGLRERVGGAEFLFADSYLGRAGRPHSFGPSIALIYGTGAVQTGSSSVNPLAGGTVMGAETVTRAFRDAIESDAVRAIIFRVDSPGGSYVASDAIWRETIRAREAGKPVIVSMGSVAGSGGYFVAMGADRIVAHPSTITGSIGVYGGKMVLGELSSRLGITWDDVRVGGNATMWSAVEDYSPEEWARLEANLDRIYLDFTTKAAEGRGLSRDSVHTLARGRIWTGADALRFGLVDELGGMNTAIRLAKEAAGIEAESTITLREFPRRRTLVQSLFESESSGYVTAVAGLIEGVRGIAAELSALGIIGPRGELSMPGAPRIR